MHSWTVAYPAARPAWKSPCLALSLLAHLALFAGLTAAAPRMPAPGASPARRAWIAASLQQQAVVLRPGARRRPGPADPGLEHDRGQAARAFPQGRNRLLLKLSNGPKHVFFSVPLTPG